MKKTDRNALIAFPIVVLIGAGVAVAGSQGGATAFGVPVFALCVALAFVIQWLAFVPAYLLQSEGFFDLTGSVTYITVTTIAVVLGPDGRRPVDPAARAGGDLGGAPRHLPVPPHPQGRQGRPLRRHQAVLHPLPQHLDAAGVVGELDAGRRSGGHHDHRPQGPGASSRIVGFAGLGRRVRRSRRRPTSRRAVSARTRRTGARSSTPVCGPGHATPTTSARSCSGSAWRSSRCPSCRAGSG